MKRPSLPALFALAAVLLLLWALRTQADRFQAVHVVNLPQVQQVAGSVDVESPVPHTRMERRVNLVLSPAARDDPAKWSSEGVLETDGFTHVVLGLTGDVRGQLGRAGSVGAILVPDEDRPRKILQEADRAVLSLEVSAELDPGSSHFASDPIRLPLGFPSYRIYLWNDSANSLTVDLHAYLTH